MRDFDKPSEAEQSSVDFESARRDAAEAIQSAFDVSARKLTPEAERALAEAQERRAQQQMIAMPPELHGRQGLEPVRYGDWEINGIICDF